MKTIIIALSIFLSVILILLFPLRCKAKFVLDLKTRNFYFTLSVFKLNLASGKIYLLDDYSFSVITRQSKIMQTNDPQKMQQLMVQKMLSNIKINEVVLLLDGGLQDNAFFVSMAIGTFRMLLSAFVPQIKGANVRLEVNPLYDENNLNIASKINVSLNMLNIIISIIYAKTKYSNLVKEGVLNEKK